MLRAAARLILPLLLLALAGCVAVADRAQRTQTAEAIAAAGGLTRDDITAGGYTLAAFHRAGTAGQPLRIYLEGDGLAWISRSRPSPDPTPLTPLALQLAARDAQTSRATIVWLARPCQYRLVTTGDAGCTVDDWTDARFSPRIIGAVNTAVTEIMRRYGAPTAELVGYSGGAAVAVLVAAQRSDIARLRTVAGTLDTDAFAESLKVSPLAGSLNPGDVAPRLTHLPQLHLTGGADTTVLPAVYDRFAARMGDSPCRQHQVIPDATHTAGWLELWPALLARPVECINN